MEGMISHRLPIIIKEHEEAKSKGEVIHSGHFMISSVADQDDIDDEVCHDRDSPVHHDQVIRLREGYDFSDVRKETQNTYQFGHRSTNQITIDASLSRLFECMSLAYRGGKVVSPKWKNFKGMKLSVKDKIRLNNAIWRTWHIQYIMKRKRNKLSFVQFATPLDNESDCDSHSKPEAVVMEGKYWKRRIETVVAEYKKWRAFFMDKLQQSDHPGLTWVSNQSPATPDNISSNLDLSMSVDDSEFAYLAEKLFRGLSQPFQFPNPREIAQHATNSDMMQPGLLQLQPPIDDFMDPLDALQDIFSPNKKSPFNGSNSISLFYSGSNSTQSAGPNEFTNTMMMQQDLNAHRMQESSLEELVQRATAGHDTNIMTIAENMPQMSGRQQQQQETQMQVQPANSYCVSDPMMNKSANDQMFLQFGNVMPTTSPMMISKQQQNTPTISQVVMAHTPHHHPSSGLQFSNHHTKSQMNMPPPQKKPPRRRSFNKSQNNGVVTTPVATPMTVQILPQPPSNSDVQMVPMNFQHTQVNNHQGQTQVNPPFVMPTSHQVVMTPQMNKYAVSQQVAQMRVDGASHTHHLNAPIVQGTSRQNLTCSINTNSQGVDNILTQGKGLDRPAPTLIIPVTLQQTIPSQAGIEFNQPPQKKPLLVREASNPEIVVKQPSSTTVSSQHTAARHQTLLTQLLTTGRQDVNKSPTLQLPPNVVIAPAREAQLKQVREQATNFNKFQNSLLLAAAQMAATPQPQSAPQNGNPTNMTFAQSISVNDPYNSLQTATKETTDKNNLSKKDSWGIGTSIEVTTMDTDEGACQSKHEFVSQMEKKTYSTVTSPASSSTSSASSDQRAHHFTAEQKRRCNIKSLCDRLQEILPDISNHPNQKMSKAVLLGKSCSHVRQLQNARQQTAAEIQQLKKRIELLNQDISNFQQQLPATGAPVSRHRGDMMKAVFDEWVRDRTLNDWKFFIFSMIIRPWFNSYDQSVSNTSLDELCRSCVMWLEKHCSLSSLRRGVVDSLQELGTTTSILTDPTILQQQAESAVKRHPSRHSSNSSS